MSINHNIIVLSKVGSDTLLCCLYINKDYQLPSLTESKSSKNSIVINGITIHFPNVEILEKAREIISGRIAWYEDMKAEKRSHYRSTITLMKVNTLTRRKSISYWNSPQLSPASVDQKVIGVSLQDLSQRENSQQASMKRKGETTEN